MDFGILSRSGPVNLGGWALRVLKFTMNDGDISLIYEHRATKKLPANIGYPSGVYVAPQALHLSGMLKHWSDVVARVPIRRKCSWTLLGWNDPFVCMYPTISSSCCKGTIQNMWISDLFAVLST